MIDQGLTPTQQAAIEAARDCRSAGVLVTPGASDGDLDGVCIGSWVITGSVFVIDHPVSVRVHMIGAQRGSLTIPITFISHHVVSSVSVTSAKRVERRES